MEQREIKFRVLVETDDAEAEMIYLGKVECDNGLWFDAPKHIDSYKSVMQYTGLNDAKGKEIYEGDIVKRESGTSYKVQINEADAKFEMRRIGDDYPFDFFELRAFEETIEVIGNIYENPELLKV